jgi:P pilus assembly chaperone PapD
MIGSRVWLALILLLAMCSARAEYDLVIAGGRVIDPASGTDQVLNVGVTNGTIVPLSARLI